VLVAGRGAALGTRLFYDLDGALQAARFFEPAVSSLFHEPKTSSGMRRADSDRGSDSGPSAAAGRASPAADPCCKRPQHTAVDVR
jgi:hypothetical protein